MLNKSQVEKTKYYSEDGGIQTYRTVEYEQKAVDWLLKTFPMYCVINKHKKGWFYYTLYMGHSG